MSPRRSLLGALKSLLTPSRRTPATTTSHGDGRSGFAATIEIAPPAAKALRITYQPDLDGDPDAGEIIWTWVPYAERDGRGKDRPVLVIGRLDDSRVYAVRLTSKSHDGDRDFLAIGSGPWDPQGRPSWVDIEQLYTVHSAGMRREASALDLERFTRVASALHQRYGWAVEGA
ncbi:type II toxin-antitoxin system PemK/MazF family toxin [Microbacterium sp. 4R-513]|uniref:type II toxin-antitoxin system PemK/MazF family toxin n=1 Tax=Microbacterium sp. 4R-513 TaxID=2567934 RepID=UPI0013E1628A|nr:type II toxin-antitoxin system PemK/MazF family toxin [Microbacterium sp. 4R-513]QIG40667.1 type II toxin-antitoxin system PemK/MazF family toxin [Microbacterium sp. 4R-513]